LRWRVFAFGKVGISLTGTMTDAIRLRLMGNSSRDESKIENWIYRRRFGMKANMAAA
jgi:hypothetical protein